MTRVLLTGLSATGKSTLIGLLGARGHAAVDLDAEEWSEWIDLPDGPDPLEPGGVWRHRDWVWREDRVGALLGGDDVDVLFVAGCASNQGPFHPRFDHIVLLSAPATVIAERLATRTSNAYGKHPDELARVLGQIETVEPLLRRVASLEVDTSAPADQVLETVLRLVRPDGR